MYHGYNSLRESIQKEIESQKSVLNKFPESIGRPITQSCSKYLAQFTSYQLPFKAEAATGGSNVSGGRSSTSQQAENSSGSADLNFNNASQGGTVAPSAAPSQSIPPIQLNSGNLVIPENMIMLETAEQVNWVLENLMYGLTLSHDFQDTIKDCWNVYHDWLCVLLDDPKPFLPQPIRDEPILYSRKMLWHLYHLFVPRKDAQAPTKHIMMCHGVLILIEGIAKDSRLLKRDLWEDFLKFFLAINDAVLAPPFNKDDFGEIMSSRIVATLFEIWLIACNRVFPSPSLWKTFQELCANWRHHISLVIEWNRVCHALTNRLLELTWWPDMGTNSFTKSQAVNDTNVACDIHTIIGQMSMETVIQSWFRFMHIIGKPSDFCDHLSISKTLEMVRINRLASFSKDGIDSTATGSGAQNTTGNFACIKKLPIIFLEVIKGISRLVDAFLGQNNNSTLIQLVHHQYQIQLNKQILTAPANLMFDQKSRSKSVLVTSSDLNAAMNNNTSSSSLSSNPSSARLNPYRLNRTSVNSLLHLVGQWLFDAAFIPSREYILGQAESCGILCKIFSSIRTNETVSLDYLSRFYALLIQGLRVPTNLGEFNSNTLEYEGGEILASIIVNGCNIFKLDLEGSSIIIIPMINALHAVFKLKYSMREEPNRPKELMKTVFNVGAQSVTLVELKRYCIVIFNSLLSMPNHFGQVGLNEFGLTYYSLRSKILEIFLAAMTNEIDTMNLQMLFGCGRLIVGEWTLDELTKTPNEIAMLDKKERASYCYNQIVSLICAPLKINNTTLQNHSFALSIFDSLASIAAGDLLVCEEDSVCKLAISWIWHYVRMQIKRRSREHTKEMHSVIVAAYNCLIMLLITKPSVLKDKNCLHTVTNCVEIGISGSSSYPEQKLREDNFPNNNAGNNKEIAPTNFSNSTTASSSLSSSTSSTLMKSEKELKPASLRVKEAAECVLYYLMEHTSAPAILTDNSHDLTRVALDEKSLLELIGKPASTRFKYFAIDGCLIVAILEKPLVKTPISSICPAVTILIRGAFGRQAWSLHLRTSPFSDLENISVDSKGNAIPRVLSCFDSSHLNKMNQNNGSYNRHSMVKDAGVDGTLKAVNNLNLTDGEGKSKPKCEQSIPVLRDVADKCVGSHLAKFQKLKDEQIDFELSAMNRIKSENNNSKEKNISSSHELLLSTKNCNEFQSARMLLSHLGFCSLGKETGSPDVSEIYNLDGSDTNFLDQLQILDSLLTRTFSFSTIFYVKANQTNASSILNNINQDSQLDDNFYMFLHSLGSIIDVNELSKRKQTASPKTNTDKLEYARKLNKINGTENILYWSDISSEICFLIPNGGTDSGPMPITANVNDDLIRAKYQSVPSDVRVVIVWLEQFQDADQIPIDELLQETTSAYDPVSSLSAGQLHKQKEIIVIFIHPLKNKLNRIALWSSVNRRPFYTMPLIDGMVVGSKMLSSMVRQTVLNIFRRKRLEIDDYQPPHVKRKNKISDIIKRYQTKKTEPDFFTSLLMGT